MATEENQYLETANPHRPGAVPGPPAMPSLIRPGALPTPAHTGVAPARPGSRLTEVEVLSSSVDPPAVSAFRPQPSAAPGSGPMEVRPGIQPAGSKLIAPPWKERAHPTLETPTSSEPAQPRPVMERANPREAGVRVRQMEEGPWPWSATGVETAAKVDHPYVAESRRQAEVEAQGALDRRPRRGFPWKAWTAFAVVWTLMFWLVLQREVRLDQALERKKGESALEHRANTELPSHIGVENPKEVKLR